MLILRQHIATLSESIKVKALFLLIFYFKYSYNPDMTVQKAKFSIGDIVKHKHFDFRGVIYDVDFEFNNSEE